MLIRVFTNSTQLVDKTTHYYLFLRKWLIEHRFYSVVWKLLLTSPSSTNLPTILNFGQNYLFSSALFLCILPNQSIHYLLHMRRMSIFTVVLYLWRMYSVKNRTNQFHKVCWWENILRDQIVNPQCSGRR